MTQSDFRILIIDDNKEIHADFIKVLKLNDGSSNLSQKEIMENLDKELFNEEPNSFQAISLPVFQIDTASQGQEGVELIKKGINEGLPYALAFIDMRMPPGLNGIETIKEIWKLDRDIQTVICTAYSDYSWEETVNELGVNDNLLILKKPFDTIAVRQIAYALTKKWKLMLETKDYSKLLENKIQERTISLEKSISLTRATLDSVNDGILVVDDSDTIIDYNNKFVELWEMTHYELDRKSKQIILEIILNKTLYYEEFSNEFRKSIDLSQNIVANKIRLLNGNIYEVNSQPYALHGKIKGRVWSFTDMTKRTKLEEQLEYQAMHDPLTDLPNRILLYDRIKQMITKSQRNLFDKKKLTSTDSSKNSFAIIYLDLDRFKLINDSLGHLAGDEVLKVFSSRIQAKIRGEDTLARVGGDEFILLLQHQDENEVEFMARKLMNVIKEPMVISDRELVLSSSMGIALYPQDGKTPDELIGNADLAMYRAKEFGSAHIYFFTPELNQGKLVKLEEEIELRQAIEHNDFIIHYQPQYKIHSDMPYAAEALVRWNHPQRGLLLPIDFISLAEKTGLIVPLGELVLRQACKQNKEWQNKGLSPIRICVNIATKQLRQEKFIETIKNILNETNLDPKYLEIELTENVIINNIDIIKTISEIKNLGIHVSIDDFGTGTTSISHLKKLELDSLKIDKSFIDNINKNRSDEIIIKAIIAMAKSMNFDVLGEGVETKEQLDFLEKLKCENIQGYYYSKPIAAEYFEALIAGSDAQTVPK